MSEVARCKNCKEPIKLVLTKGQFIHIKPGKCKKAEYQK